MNDSQGNQSAVISMLRLVPAFLIVVLFGCASAPEKTPAETEQELTDQIVEGKTTEAELVRILGGPSFYVKPKEGEGPGQVSVWILKKVTYEHSTTDKVLGVPAKSITEYSIKRRALVRDGIVVRYTSETSVTHTPLP